MVRGPQPLRRSLLRPVCLGALQGRRQQCRARLRRGQRHGPQPGCQQRPQHQLPRQRRQPRRRGGLAAAHAHAAGGQAQAALLGVRSKEDHGLPRQPHHSLGRGAGDRRPGRGDLAHEGHGRLRDGLAAGHAHLRRVWTLDRHLRHRGDQPLQGLDGSGRRRGTGLSPDEGLLGAVPECPRGAHHPAPADEARGLRVHVLRAGSSRALGGGESLSEWNPSSCDRSPVQRRGIRGGQVLEPRQVRRLRHDHPQVRPVRERWEQLARPGQELPGGPVAEQRHEAHPHGLGREHRGHHDAELPHLPVHDRDHAFGGGGAPGRGVWLARDPAPVRGQHHLDPVLGVRPRDAHLPGRHPGLGGICGSELQVQSAELVPPADLLQPCCRHLLGL
mmetsp:Transcript_52329/g.162382  ORF Transcript_52329/g.162382 Transcript_52329/m.162382 type:complete len:388 (+) Transcript_52329:1050-2213(+)